MTTVFIAGSISISHLHERVQERINKIASSDFCVLVGDADGADTSIQECLRQSQARNVTVYCSGQRPRNNVSDWPVHHVHSKAREGTRAFFTAKDVEMARRSDYGLMIWDCKSTGTLSNVLELLSEKKKSLVFVNKNKDFVTVGDVSGLNLLLDSMSPNARAKAEAKVGLAAKVAALNQVKMSFQNEDRLVDLQSTKSLEDRSAVDATKEEQPRSIRLRHQLAATLKDYIARAGLNQLEAARVFGVTQPRISDLTRGKLDLFGLDTLVNMASTAGMQIEMRILNSD